MRRKYNPATTAKPAPIELKASPRKSPRAKNMNSIAKKRERVKLSHTKELRSVGRFFRMCLTLKVQALILRKLKHHLSAHERFFLNLFP